MKNRLILLLIFCSTFSLLKAAEGLNQHFSPEEFRKKQKEFIIEKASLSDKETEEFFPVYFQLHDKKRELNDQIMKLMRQVKEEESTEKECKETIEAVHELRVKQLEAEKEYYEKVQKVLSYKKILLVQKAEMRFHRELLKKMNVRKEDKPHSHP